MAEYTIPNGTATVDGSGAYSYVNPGDTLLLPAGSRGAISFNNLDGTAAKPIIIKNTGGRVTFSVAGAGMAVTFDNCTHIRFTGSGAASVQYGIRIMNYSNCGIWFHNGSEYGEFDHIEIDGQYLSGGDPTAAGMRIWTKTTEVAVFTLHDVTIRDCWLHDIAASALYWGLGLVQDGQPMSGCYAYNNLIERTRTDGIQLRQGTANVEIYNNTVRDTALDVVGTTQGGAGLIVGEDTVGSWHHNIVDHCDRGIQLLSHGANVLVYNNIVYDCGWARNEGGIKVFTNGNNAIISNNTVVNSVNYGIETKPADAGITLRSNLVAQSGGVNISSAGTLQNNCSYATSAQVKFVNAAAHDYHLTETSPAIGAGYLGIDCGALPFSGTVFPERLLRAFPSAQGAGAMSQGGRGSTVYKVTTLADSGVGSFRAACEASGARYVVFYVGGYITLTSEINIANPYITILGQTAPGHGITIRGKRVRITTHDVVCRYIRFSPGPLTLDNQALLIEYMTSVKGIADRIPRYIIFDHCEFRWATDANVRLLNSNWDLYQPANNVGVDRIEKITFQWCFFYECFDYASSVPYHSYNFVVEGGCTNISLHHNLFASCRSRNPDIRGGTVEVINNIIFNCEQGTRFGGPVDQDGLEPAYVNYIANREMHGYNTPATANYMCMFSTTGSACTDPANEKNHEIYPLDNAGSYRVFPGGDNWDIMGCTTGVSPADNMWETGTPHAIIGGRPVVIDTIWAASTSILAHGGCKMPFCFGWDKAGWRLVRSVPLHGGRMPSSFMTEVGGWPVLSPGYPMPADPDNDGIWSGFETTYGSNPAVADQDDYDYATPPYRAPYCNIETWGNILAKDPHVLVNVDVN